MTKQIRFFMAVAYALILLSVPSFAQTPERRQTSTPPQAQEQSPTLPPNAGSIDVVANEIGQLRRSLQTLNTRLREISEKVVASGSSAGGSSNDRQSRISASLDLLSRAEVRAEMLRKQLLELTEKETTVRNRLVQIEEEMRPESIERALTLVGSTRSVELREVRRRVLENQRQGFESLLSQTAQSRLRLEDDVKQADAMVSRLRQRLLPIIEREIEKITPN